MFKRIHERLDSVVNMLGHQREKFAELEDKFDLILENQTEIAKALLEIQDRQANFSGEFSASVYEVNMIGNEELMRQVKAELDKLPAKVAGKFRI